MLRVNLAVAVSKKSMEADGGGLFTLMNKSPCAVST